MHEMLGNQFFLVRNYRRAAEMLEKALLLKPGDKAIRRKLIICFTQLGEVPKALQEFSSLIQEDIDFIVDIDPEEEDCPCPELVEKMEKLWRENRESIDFNLILGMLYLYCDLSKSIAYFERSVNLAPECGEIQSVLNTLRERAEKQTNQN